MIDAHGFRLNVGIIIANSCGQVFWGKRIHQNAWQFPQGGLNKKESFEDAVFRELWEEVGISSDQVKIISSTKRWLRYKLPKRLQRKTEPMCIGQKQRWFLLHFTGSDDKIQLDASTKPEFDQWSWVNYWYPLHEVINFKRNVYQKALKELAPYFFKIHMKMGRARNLDLLSARHDSDR